MCVAASPLHILMLNNSRLLGLVTIRKRKRETSKANDDEEGNRNEGIENFVFPQKFYYDDVRVISKFND